MRMNRSFLKLAVFAVGLVVIQGCAFFSSPTLDANDGIDNNFQATVAPKSNPTAVPVEVATEMSHIVARKGSHAPTILSPEEQTTTLVSPDSINSSDAQNDEEDDSEEEEQAPTKTPGKSGHAHGKFYAYKVAAGDTLMKIAFEKFGNVYRWREIYDGNQSVIANYNKLTPGSTLTLSGEEYVVIQRNGQPYLIKKHDTLSKISGALYGTLDKWRNLWKNNPQLIHNPNKIYAGFTLYYQPEKKPNSVLTQKTLSQATPTLPAKAPAPEPEKVVAPTTAVTATAAVTIQTPEPGQAPAPAAATAEVAPETKDRLPATKE